MLLIVAREQRYELDASNCVRGETWSYIFRLLLQGLTAEVALGCEYYSSTGMFFLLKLGLIHF